MVLTIRGQVFIFLAHKVVVAHQYKWTLQRMLAQEKLLFPLKELIFL